MYRPSTILASIALVLPSACKDSSDSPASPAVACPPMSVTQDGRPVVFDAAKAFHDPNDERFGVILLRDVLMPCEVVVNAGRRVRDLLREPELESELEILVSTFPDLGLVVSDSDNAFVRPLDIVHDGRSSDGRIALCVARPVTLKTDRGALVVQGLVEGVYCGETPPKPEVGLMAEDQCPALELRQNGRAVDGYRALAYGEPGERLEVAVFPGTTEVSCEELAAGRSRRLVTISADAEGGSLMAVGWIHGNRRARPVRFGSSPGDRVAVCVPQREEWDEGAIVGLVEAQYCGRDPNALRWE